MTSSTSARIAVPATVLCLTTLACAGAARPPVTFDRGSSAALPPLALAGDAGSVDTVAPGVLHRSWIVDAGPWAVHVLDVDRSRCPGLVAVKGSTGAIGRTTTSALVTRYAREHRDGEVAGGINADFFVFDPPGVPTGALVSDGRVITGPGARPVLGVDSTGRTWIGHLSASGWLVAGSDSMPVESWNRASARGLAWFDARYGERVDTATGSIRVVVAAGGTVLATDTGAVGTPIPARGGVLMLQRSAPLGAREHLLLLGRARSRVDVRVGLWPFHPREAVGGFPVLVRDSAEVAGLDSAGSATFGPVRHPRTFVGVGAGGRRLFLVTVDGRQEGYSAGTTLRETARLALQLGATEAINLDGGGSTTMAVARRDSSRVRYAVVNKPSDAQGERPVGDALVVACAVEHQE